MVRMRYHEETGLHHTLSHDIHLENTRVVYRSHRQLLVTFFTDGCGLGFGC